MYTAAFDSAAAGPWSHSTVTAATALRACQGVSAITATAPVPPFRASTASTFFTPGSFSAAAPSMRATLPPRVGHITTAACSRPGGFASMPNTALPSSLPRASMRVSGLPMRRNCAGSLSATLPGSGCCAARAASSPKRARWPAACSTTPACTLHSVACTFHCAAAARTSMARALAPASRMGRHRSLMLDEPPVIITPTSRMVLAVSQPATAFMEPSLSGWKGRPSTTVARLL